MKIQKPILDETRHIAIGVLLLDAVMILVYLALGKLTYRVPLGAVLGSFFAVANFFLMGISLQKALEKGEGAKKYTQRTYAERMAFCLAGMALGVALPCFDSVAALVPFLMPKVVIYIMQGMKMIRPGNTKESEEENREE